MDLSFRQIAGPMDQFTVYEILPFKIGNVDLAFTNVTLFMLLGVVLIIGFFALAASRGRVVPSRIQSMGEIGYTFVADMIRSVAGEEGLRFFPFVFTLFFFIFAANFIGLVPYAFTTTSQLIITAALALLVITIVFFYGLYKNGLGFFKLFAPAGAPFVIYLILTPIEIISFIARPATLALRLFANMMAGHILIKLFAGFTVSLIAAASAVSVLAIFSFTMGIAINALEFLVAGLQAYVFAVLTCVYLNDALHPSH